MKPVTLKPPAPFIRQPTHLAALTGLFLLLARYLQQQEAGLMWGALALLTAAVHQGLVAGVWRYTLFTPLPGAKRLKRRIRCFAVFFALFLASRLAMTVAASLWTGGKLLLPKSLRWAAMGLIILLAGWTYYSVIRYFGMFRALGADHFVPAYRQKPFVAKGVFRYTSNAMYTFGTLVFLLPGLWLQSRGGLAVGLYHYLAIWIHYWATEKPDIAMIYHGALNKHQH